MKINHSLAGYYWYCFECRKRGRPKHERADAVKSGQLHLARHRRKARAEQRTS